MPHYDTRRSLTIPAEQAHQTLVQGLPTIKDVTVTTTGNPISFERKRRLTANRNAMNGTITLDGSELRISIDGLGSAHQKFAKEIYALLPESAIDDQGLEAALSTMERSAKFFASSEIRGLLDDLRQGEHLEFVTSGNRDKSPCAIVLTTQRVILKDASFASTKSREFTPGAVTSIETSKKMTGDTVKLTVSGNEIDIESMPHGRGVEFAERLRVLREQANAPQSFAAPAPAVDADQLAKLAELHAAGVLTDEEFAAAKAKALGL